MKNRRLIDLVPISSLFLPLLIALLGSGCSSFSVRPGIWELSFEVERMDTKDPLVVPRREVRVIVGALTVDGQPEIREGIDIEALDSGATSEVKTGVPYSGRDLKKLLGNIAFQEGHEPAVSIRHKEPRWDFAMLGLVKNPEWIAGTQFRGKILFTDPPVMFDGTWNMKWVREE